MFKEKVFLPALKPPGSHLNIKMSSYQLWDSHDKDEMLSQPSSLYYWNTCTWKVYSEMGPRAPIQYKDVILPVQENPILVRCHLYIESGPWPLLALQLIAPLVTTVKAPVVLSVPRAAMQMSPTCLNAYPVRRVEQPHFWGLMRGKTVWVSGWNLKRWT